MEFPTLGDHCSDRSCNRLDFLPMKCDACSNIYCNDHFQYNKHSCNNAYQKDVQVPVCPLCNKPVPSKRGEQPDIAVGQHIDRDCQADPAIAKRKIYTNKCCVKGCKQKEVIQLTCDVCRRNYCLKHRHPTDHKCTENVSATPSQAAGSAAIARAKTSRKSTLLPWLSKQSCASRTHKKPTVTPLPEVCVTSVQGRMSEDEALALALQKSLNETNFKMQEEEDRLLALSLANCDQNPNILQREPSKDKSCSVS